MLFLLVHGTWARNALWTRDASPLVRRLRSAFPDARVERTCWTGANRFSARLAGGRELRQKIEREREAQPGVQIFLVGHSHGGSCISYALRELKAPIDDIVGAIYVSTPFMSVRLRSDHRALFLALLVGVAVITAQLGLFFAGRALFMLEQPGIPGSRLVALGIPVAAMGILVAVGVIFARRQRIYAWFAGFEPLLRRLETAQAPGCASLYLRSTGDEVALALGALQILGWASSRSGSHLADVSNRISATASRIWRHSAGKPFIVACGLALGFGIAGAGAISETFGPGAVAWIDILNPFARTWSLSVGGWAQVSIEFTYRLLLGIGVLFTGLLLVLSLTFASMLALNLFAGVLALRAFGRWDPVRATFLELAAEPVPLGAHTFVHVDPNPEDPDRLRHSSAYQTNSALTVLVDWVRSRLAAASGAD